MFYSNPWIQENYYCSDVTGRTVQPYGVVMFYKLLPQNVYIKYLPSRMARSFLYAEFIINQEVVSQIFIGRHLSCG